MPIYEYVCRRCDRAFEALVPRPDSKASCPECGSKQVKKAISVPGGFTTGASEGEVCARPDCAKGP